MTGPSPAPLAEKADIVRGVTFSKADAVGEPRDGYSPVLRAGNIQGQLILDHGLVFVPESKISEKQRLRCGDIVMCTSSGSTEIVGKTAYSEKDWDGSFGAFCAVVRPKEGQCHPRYLFHYLQSPKFRDWTRNSSGAGIKNIRKSELDAVEISFPNIDEQRRIARILDKAEAIRRKREQSLDLADEFLKSVFLEVFGDPVLNPHGFRESRLDQLADITSGLTKGRKTKGDQVMRPVPYMRVANVQDGHLNLSEIKEIEATPTEIEKFLLKKDDLLLTEGGDPDKLGRGSVWNDEIEECIHQNHIFRVRLFSEEIDSKILQLQIGSSRGKRYFLQAAKQTTGIASINKRQLSAYPVLIPDKNLQNEYLNIASACRTTIENLKASWIESSQLFSSISQRAFRGEL